MRVELLEYPGERDWIEVYRRALVTVGKDTVKIPSDDWKRKILAARHSPIRKKHDQPRTDDGVCRGNGAGNASYSSHPRYVAE